MAKGLSKEQIDEFPQYLYYLLMGAISNDKIGLKLSQRDGAEFRAIMAGKREKMKGLATT